MCIRDSVGGEGPRVQHPEPRQREETEVEEPVGERARGGATEDALAVAAFAVVAAWAATFYFGGARVVGTRAWERWSATTRPR